MPSEAGLDWPLPGSGFKLKERLRKLRTENLWPTVPAFDQGKKSRWNMNRSESAAPKGEFSGLAPEFSERLYRIIMSMLSALVGRKSKGRRNVARGGTANRCGFLSNQAFSSVIVG